ncbi:hypothetical protein GDO78_017141 [Eleutherodactylus coqui]|uniref:Uncharacterized protein n=1 Tax=Eleutherodactylus coqui TaxID=57060 RepID=A0A8J6EBB2_ELECQ|nr:hypothetical protein GDO78_017141 [Eleutherodactylus coqui]
MAAASVGRYSIGYSWTASPILIKAQKSCFLPRIWLITFLSCKNRYFFKSIVFAAARAIQVRSSLTWPAPQSIFSYHKGLCVLEILQNRERCYISIR